MQQKITNYFRKRSGSPLRDPPNSAKRIKLDDAAKSAMSPASKRESYRKGGTVHTFHGVVYQLKLLMFFLKRALDMKYKFNLGTEVEDAEKLDDLVFKYQSTNDKIRFVQAKHKQDESKRITAHDLLTKNASGNDFSLQKYFTSFRKIKEKTAFNNYELQDLIIYTNIDFNYSDLENAKIQLKNVEEYDEILHVNKSEKSAVRCKLSVEEEHELYQILIETSDLYLLTKKLVDHLLDDKLAINLSDNVWERFHVPLRKEVFNLDNEKENEKAKQENSEDSVRIKFRDDFVENINLSQKVSDFRKALKSIFGNKDKDDDEFKIKLRTSTLIVPSNFGEEFQLIDPRISDPEELAKKIAECSSKAEEKIVSISRRARVIKSNIDKLAGHVLVLDDEGVLFRFRKHFFDDNHKLDGNLNTFRASLKANLAEEDFGKLREYRYKITNFNACKETSEGELWPSYETELPSNISKSEIIEFFGKLTFAVNQPSEIELGDIIAKELGESSQFNLLNSDLINDSFQRQMLDWFKEKKGTFLEYDDGLNFFNSIEQKVNSLICIALSLPVHDELQAYSIQFEKNDIFDFLKTLLYPTTASPQVLHLVTAKVTILSELKVYDALEILKRQDTQFKKQDSYIFVKLGALLQRNTQRIALEAFKACGSHHILIVTCESIEEEIEIQQLYNKLKKILSEVNKLIILIAAEDNSLVKKFAADHQMCAFKSNTNFDHLTDGSKKTLLDKEVIFHGERGGLKINQFFSQLDSNDIIDSETLVYLISSKTINIGRKLMGKSELEGAYDKIYECIDKRILISALRESVDTKVFFVISGLEGAVKKDFIKNLGLNESQTCELTLENDSLHNKAIANIIFVDSKFKTNNFKQLCDTCSSENFYWIKWQDNKFILDSLYNSTFIERQFKYPNKSTFSDDVKMELLKSSEDDVFFFTGVDKPEELFEILELHDDKEQEVLNKNFESRKVTVQKLSSRSERDFNNLSKEKAEENKTAYWLHIRNDGDEKQIVWRDVTRQTIFEADLIGTLEGQSSIIIDKPGMGKSTTLAILSEKVRETHWVVFITLRDWQETINNLPDEVNKNVVIDFLSVTKNLNTPLEKNLAKFLLDKEREGGLKPLLFMFDGFDEIRSYDAKNVSKRKVEELLRFLKENTRSTIWITSREQDATKLQNILSRFCVKFEPLKEKEHYIYFKDFWRNSLKLSMSKNQLDNIFSEDDSKFNRYYVALSKAADAIFAEKNNDFMGIPLTLRLFAEGFRNKFKEFICLDEGTENFTKDFNNLSILNLYKYFVDRKLEIFIWEKTSLSSGFTKTSAEWFRQKLIKLHCRLAFRELFGGDVTKELLGLKIPFEGENSCVNSTQLTELFNVGIIRCIKEVDYEFLHRTVAEYLASRLLIYILKNKEHNNLSKYKRILQFLRNNILKQSNEIIKKFLNAGLQHDKKLYDVLQPIIIDLESKNLLGQVNSKYTFTMDAHRYNKAGDLNEIQQKIETHLTLTDGSFSTTLEPAGFRSIIGEFKPSFIHETDIEKLQDSLGYLVKIYGKVYCPTVPRYNNIIKFLLRETIIDIVSHYISQAEKQNKLNKKFVEYCFNKICTSCSKVPKWNLSKIDEIIKYIADKKPTKNTLIDSIFATGILTIEIAETIVSQFSDKADAIRVFFYSLISPLLTFKHYCSKYSFILVNNIDNAALLHIFQAFASAYRRKNNDMDLCQVSLEGILHCIQELLNPVNFSKYSFAVSVKALIALEAWDFQLTYTNSALNLRHIHGYNNELNLKYEENIIELLIFRNNNPKSNFDAQLAAVANKLSVAIPASI